MPDLDNGPELLFRSTPIIIEGIEWRLLVINFLLSRKLCRRQPLLCYYWRSKDTALWQSGSSWPGYNKDLIDFGLPADTRQLFEDNIATLREVMGQYFPEEEQISLL